MGDPSTLQPAAALDHSRSLHGPSRHRIAEQGTGAPSHVYEATVGACRLAVIAAVATRRVLNRVKHVLVIHDDHRSVDSCQVCNMVLHVASICTISADIHACLASDSLLASDIMETCRGRIHHWIIIVNRQRSKRLDGALSTKCCHLRTWILPIVCATIECALQVH